MRMSSQPVSHWDSAKAVLRELQQYVLTVKSLRGPREIAQWLKALTVIPDSIPNNHMAANNHL